MKKASYQKADDLETIDYNNNTNLDDVHTVDYNNNTHLSDIGKVDLKKL